MAPASRRARWLVGGAVAGAGVLVIGAALEGTLVYAASPADVRPGVHQRVEGTVAGGSLVTVDGGATFSLDRDGHRLPVRAVQAPAGTFREGEGAVVEGTLNDSGIFVADTVISQHGNSYRAAK